MTRSVQRRESVAGDGERGLELAAFERVERDQEPVVGAGVGRGAQGGDGVGGFVDKAAREGLAGDIAPEATARGVIAPTMILRTRVCKGGSLKIRLVV